MSIYRHPQMPAGRPCNKRYAGGRKKKAGLNQMRPAPRLFAVQSGIYMHEKNFGSIYAIFLHVGVGAF